MKKGQMIEVEVKRKKGKKKYKLYVLRVGSTGVEAMDKDGNEFWLPPNVAKRAKVIKEKEAKEAAITPRQRVQLKKQLAERTKIRHRKEAERRQHIYK